MTGTAAAPLLRSGFEYRRTDVEGVTVNCVIPGAVSPGMTDRATEANRSYYVNASPFKRIGRAEEIAELVAYLTSIDGDTTAVDAPSVGSGGGDFCTFP